MTKQHGLIMTAAGGILLTVSAFLDRLTYESAGVGGLELSDKVVDIQVGIIVLIGGIVMFVLAIATTVKDDLFNILRRVAMYAPVAVLFLAYGASQDRSNFNEAFGDAASANWGIGLFVAITGAIVGFIGMIIARSNSTLDLPGEGSPDVAKQMAAYDAARATEQDSEKSD